MKDEVPRRVRPVGECQPSGAGGNRSGRAGQCPPLRRSLVSIGELFDLGIANAGVMTCPKSRSHKARLNGNRRGCRVGEEGLRCRDARVAISPLVRRTLARKAPSSSSRSKTALGGLTGDVVKFRLIGIEQ